jgi:hypothetical protein
VPQLTGRYGVKMLDIVQYTLPNYGPEHQEAFKALCILMNAQPEKTGKQFSMNAGSGLKPVTRFILSPKAQRPGISLHYNRKRFDFPASFFADQVSGEHPVSLSEAARRLEGSVIKLDHSGITGPHQQLTETDWNKTMNQICRLGYMVDYPPINGYDPTKERWLFVMSDPKFEIDYSPICLDTVFQFDIVTRLTRPQIGRLFPEHEKVPHLSRFFLSVWMNTPWKGVRIRLDIRHKKHKGMTADQFMSFRRVRPNRPATHLPGIAP